MAPRLPVEAAILTLTPGDREDIESLAADKTSTTSLERPSEDDDRDAIVGEGQGGADTAARVAASVWTKNQLIIGYAL